MRLKKVLFRTVCLLAISGCIQANTVKQLARSKGPAMSDPPAVFTSESALPSAAISASEDAPPASSTAITDLLSDTSAARPAASVAQDTSKESSSPAASLSDKSISSSQKETHAKEETAVPASSKASSSSTPSVPAQTPVIVHAKTDPEQNDDAVVHAKTDPANEEPVIVHAKTDPAAEEPVTVHAKTDPATEEPVVVHAKTDPAYIEPSAGAEDTAEDFPSETASGAAVAPVPGVDIPLIVHAKTGWEETPVVEPVIQEDQITASCAVASQRGNSYASTSYGMTWDPTLSFTNSSYRFPGYTSVYAPQHVLDARSCEAVDATFQQIMEVDGIDLSHFSNWSCNVYNYIEGQFFVTYVFYAS